MAIHRGKILKEAIDAQNLSVTLIAKKTGISRQTIYTSCDNPNASLDYMIRIGNVIKHDFSIEIPELRIIAGDKNLDYKFKYHDLLEKHLELMEETNKQNKGKQNGNTQARETAPSVPKVRQRAKKQ